MERYTIKIRIPIDDNYEKVASYLQRYSYQKIFWNSFAPPHKIEYIIGPISEENVFRLKNDFREMFKDSQFRNVCSFSTEIYKDDV